METKLYTLPQATKLLPCGQRSLYTWSKSGLINLKTKVVNQRSINVIDELELQRIRKCLTPPADCIGLPEFIKDNTISRNFFLNIVAKLNIKPVNHMTKTQLGLQQYYFKPDDLTLVHQYLYQHRQTNHYLKLTINTDKKFNRAVDLTSFQLGKFINPENIVSIKNIEQWIKYGRIEGLYNVDINGRLYFTRQQAEQIKQQYRNLPHNLYGNITDLANELNQKLSNMGKIIKKLNIKTHHVLGYQGYFISQKDAQKVKQYIQTKGCDINEQT